MDLQKIDEIIEYLVNELGGDWLLTGGALVQLAFDAQRGTEDLDFVRISHPELCDEATRNQLFRWLIERGLGPEWMNPAVEPFVREVPNWQNELILLRNGSRGNVYRPCLTLFVYLKLRRGTAVDQEDIRRAWTKCPEGFNEEKLSSWASPRALALWYTVRATLPKN